MSEDIYAYSPDELSELLKEQIMINDCNMAYEIIIKKEHDINKRLYLASKILLLSGILKLRELSLIPTKEKSPLALDQKVLAPSDKVFEKIDTALKRRKLKKPRSCPFFFSYSELPKVVMDYFISDRLDGVIRNVSFGVGYGIPLDLAYNIMELTIWDYFSKNGDIKDLMDDKVIVEFGVKDVAERAYAFYETLKEYNFKPPNNVDYILNMYYNYLILPSMYLSMCHPVPSKECILFYVYSSWDRVEYLLSGLSNSALNKAKELLAEFYENYYLRFK